MRGFTAFVLLFAVSMGGAALALPPLYWALGAHFEAPPHQLLDQLAKLVAVPFFLLLLSQSGRLSAAALGLRHSQRAFWPEAAKGWVWGAAMLGVLCSLLLLIDARRLTPLEADWPIRLVTIAIGSLIAGFLIAWIEEVFFRGGLYGMIRQESGVAAAIGLSSLYFAALHFFDPAPLPPDAALSWDAGLRLMADGFRLFAQPLHILDSFLALFAAGAILALIREFRGGLAFAIGLHWGWILPIRLMQEFTRVNTTSNTSALVGDYNGIIGYFAVAYTLSLIYLLGLTTLRPILTAPTGRGTRDLPRRPSRR